MAAPTIDTLADLLEGLGAIPLNRIRFHPHPGTAAESDLLQQRENGSDLLCELVDGVLVEKPIGFFESRLAAILIHLLEDFLESHDLGVVFGADAPLRWGPGLIRLPDVSFFRWSHFPGRELPPGQILAGAPDLAVEVMSPSNTEREMERKRREAFAAGTVSFWQLYPDERRVRVYSRPDAFTELDETGELDGGEVLPGFLLRVGFWFERAGRRRSS